MGGKGKGPGAGLYPSGGLYPNGGKGGGSFPSASPSLGGFGRYQPGGSSGSSYQPSGGGKYNSGGKYSSGKGKDYKGNPFGSSKGKPKGKKDKSSNPFAQDLKEIGYQGCQIIQRVCALPQHLKHWEDVDALCMMQGKILAGSRDKSFSIWDGEQQGERMMLKQDKITELSAGVTCFLYEPNAHWLFIGLYNGQIRAFQKQPQLDLTLTGHNKAISQLHIFEKFLLSASKDGTFRVWVFSPEERTFQAQLSTPSPIGEINCIRVMGTSVENAKIWIGGEKGIASIDMKALSMDGVIPTPAPVCGPFFVFNEEHVIVGLRDGCIRCYSIADGKQEFDHVPSGQHKTTYCMEMMEAPGGRILMLCGHDGGYISVYEVPTFEPIGTFCINKHEGPRIKSICHCENQEMFVIGSEKGDVMVYKWLPTMNANNGANGIPDLSGGGIGSPDQQAANMLLMQQQQLQQQQLMQQQQQQAMQPSVNPFTGEALNPGMGGVPQQPGGGMMGQQGGGDMQMML